MNPAVAEVTLSCTFICNLKERRGQFSFFFPHTKLRRKKPEACRVPAYMGNRVCGGRLKHSVRICSPGSILLSPMTDPMPFTVTQDNILSCLCKLEMRFWHMQDPDAQQKTGLPNSIKMFWAVRRVLIRRSEKNKSGNILCMCATRV